MLSVTIQNMLRENKLITPLFSKTKKTFFNVINFKLEIKILVMGDFFQRKIIFIQHFQCNRKLFGFSYDKL